MKELRHRLSRLAFALGVSAFASSAGAHIDLKVPVPREQGLNGGPNSDLKVGPCGQLTNGRTERVAVFAPGETIEVTWAETTNHRSYYRIAFDRDGDDDFPVFAGPGIGAEGIDPRERCPVDGQVILAYEMEDGYREQHTLRVQLPDVECENCTLQVIQYMYDRMRPYYFQCADLALRRPPAGDAGAPDAGVDGRDAGAPPRVPASCSSRLAPEQAPADAPDEGAAPAPAGPPAAAPGGSVREAPPAPPTPPRTGSETRSGSGCGLGSPPASSAPHVLGLLCVAGSAWRRRRRPLVARA